MKQQAKNKLILTAIITPVLLLGAIAIFFGTRTSQTELTPHRQSGCIGELAMINSSQFVNIRPELKFKFDTGSDISTITERDLAILDSLGFKCEKKFYPVIGRDGAGDMQYESVRYTVDLPLYCWNVEKDSAESRDYDCQYGSVNVLHNVDFAPSETGFSVLGIDFIEKFKVEFRNSDKIIALHFDTPKGYEHSADMKISGSIVNRVTLGHRYFINLTVDDDTNDYFLDSGIQRAFVKRPADEVPPEGRHITNDTAVSMRGRFPAKVNSNGWLKLGQREGRVKIYYYDSMEEDHAVNIFNLFVEVNVVLDFPNKQLLFSK